MPSPELAPLVEQLRAHPLLAQIATVPMPLAEARKGFDDFKEMFPTPPDVKVKTFDANGVPCELITAPGATTHHVVLFFHGGGFVIGSAHSHRELCSRLSRASGASVLFVEYRRGPEHPFPAALEDCVTAYRWVMDTFKHDANRIAFAGDSAGGGLTVSTMLRARSLGLPPPACGVCFSAWMDLPLTGKDPVHPDVLITRHGLREMARMYLGGADGTDPFASPLYATLENLAGLPPLYLQVGSAEVLLDDSHRFAERARKAGVDVKLDEWPHLFHVFQLYPILPECTEAIAKVADFLKQNFNP
ncbi:MAG: 6-hexanolactone hydrolase [Panacagrimonas sp.]|jgi:acetyl esterase/lipase|nr:alpha/beta hydrolase [Panacagrimonas sp.]MCC2657569.1 6-hexanolactone hydrolase [Panacagrimonas sp.]